MHVMMLQLETPSPVRKEALITIQHNSSTGQAPTDIQTEYQHSKAQSK